MLRNAPLPVFSNAARAGRAGWALMAWLIGLPLPIVLIIFLMRGC